MRASVMSGCRVLGSSTGSSSEIVFKELPVDDPKTRQPDITVARARLGWEPVVGLEEGLSRTIAWFRRELGLAEAPAAVAGPVGASRGTS